MLRGHMICYPSAVNKFILKGHTIPYLFRNVWYLVRNMWLPPLIVRLPPIRKTLNILKCTESSTDKNSQKFIFFLERTKSGHNHSHSHALSSANSPTKNSRVVCKNPSTIDHKDPNIAAVFEFF